MSKDLSQNYLSRAILEASFRNETLKGVLVFSIIEMLLEVADIVD